jgi:predicted CxxxxCH...CXXCH cytochrome family protein
MRTRSLPLPWLAVAALAAASCTGKTQGVSTFALQTCTTCHGGGDNAAPPRSTTGATATSDIAVGAHQTHVNPGPFRKAVACSECHPVPMSAEQVAGNPHRNGVADVVFGPLASSGGTAPAWSRATASCSATYCHGATLGQGPESNGAPVWNRDVVQDPDDPRSQVRCGTCHGIPPPAPRHPDLTTTSPPIVPAGTTDPMVWRRACAVCHPGTMAVDAGGSPTGDIDVAGGQHVDGVTEIGAYACARCHGDPGRSPLWLTPAPPQDNAGRTATSAVGVGAHAAHLAGTSLRSSPIACSECHSSPTTMMAHPNPLYATTGVVDMSWGPLATAGGNVPSWDPATMSCAASYCHGGSLSGGKATVPIWTRVDGSQVACDSCHGMPPDSVGHASLPRPMPATGCAASTCHPNTVAADGTLKLAGGLHINGYVDIGTSTCTTCHGSAQKKVPGSSAPAPVALQAAPGGAGIDLSGDTAATARGVGAHDAHLFGASLRATPIACTECHVAVTTTDHARGHDPSTYDMMSWGPLATAGGSYPRWNAPLPRSAGCPPGGCTCAATYCHGGTLTGGTATSPVWTRVDGSQVSCTGCHGDPPPPPHEQRSDCSTCHTGYTSTSVNLALHLDGKVDAAGGSCTSCHGDPSRKPDAIAPAPPALAGTASSPWAAGDPGAHLKHLTGTLLRAAPIACAECHAVPTAPPGPPGSGDPHGDGVATVVFGRLATTDGARPGFSPVTLGCSATYCHGSTLQGGTATAPVWNVIDGRYSACGACHGLPPPTTSQGGTHPDVAAAQDCSGCHAGYGGVRGGAITVNPTLHLNGVVDFANGSDSCASCHGDPLRRPASIASAPPASALGAGGSTPPWAGGEPGAHLAHLTGTSLRSTPIACGECHTVPSTWNAGGTHRNGSADVVFGSLARAGAASPTWNPGTLGCAASYCHGGTMGGGTNTAPTWNGNATQVACGSCHGLPPPSPHPVVGTGVNCSTCHTGYDGFAGGPVTMNTSLHLDGTVEASSGTCTTCHGDAARVLVAGADAMAASAPPANAGDATSPWAGGDPGAHLAHLNPAPAGALAAPIACSECHAVPSDTSPSGTHENGAADVVFGTRARAGGAAPTWNPSTLGCAASYCHGGTMAGGTATAPTWNGGAAQVACGSCHGLPPATVARGTQPHPASSGTDCGACHPGYTATTVNPGLHVNGTVDSTGGTCTTCHGDATRVLVSGADSRTASAPPANAGDATSPWAGGDPGAHLAHLNPAPASALAAPVACSECHVVPSSTAPSGAHENGAADVAFGTLSRSGGAAPAWNAATLGCAASYCHGGTMAGGTATAPTWNGGTAQVACGSCHGLPPATVARGTRPHPASSGTDCGNCHAGYTATAVNPRLHVNGAVEATGGTCTTCHGDATRLLVSGADPQTASAPPRIAGGAGSPWASGDPGAHLAHLNPAPASALAASVACSECHAVPSSTAPSGAHENGAADVAFGTLSRSAGAAPTWNAGTLGCAASYCHGSTMAGGTNTSPTWNGGAAQVACGSCHGIPPATVAGGTRPHPASSGSDCGACHSGYTATAVNASLHVNGTVDASGGTCTSCHGDAGRVLVSGADPQTASAPPIVATAGTWPFGPGAHQAHLNKGTGAIGRHVACSECHAVPASPSPGGVHENGAADVSFGTLARAGGASPTYAAPSCSTTYCHGQFTVNPSSKGRQGVTISWDAPGPLACSACHVVNGSGVPVPNDTCHPPNFDHDGGNRCSDCHKNVSSTGTGITNATTHVDGNVNGKCTDCHAGAALGSSKNRICQ